MICRGSNNYGPHQYPEKLIPLMILNALAGDQLPVYGDGRNVRNWLFVEDFGRGIGHVLEHGEPGEAYNCGGPDECENLEVVKRILELTGADESLIEYVTDRPGHDRRYSLSSEKLEASAGRRRCVSRRGSQRTVEWYRDNALVVGADPLRRLPRVLRAPLRSRAEGREADGEAAPPAARGRHAPPPEVRLPLQRERLLRAAAAEFAERGYAGASSESISRRAGMSKATFYEHFANKEECILALFDAARGDGRPRRWRRGARAPRDDARERMRAGTRAFLTVARRASGVRADAARRDHRRRAPGGRAARPDPAGVRRRCSTPRTPPPRGAG